MRPGLRVCSDYRHAHGPWSPLVGVVVAPVGGFAPGQEGAGHDARRGARDGHLVGRGPRARDFAASLNISSTALGSSDPGRCSITPSAVARSQMSWPVLGPDDRQRPALGLPQAAERDVRVLRGEVGTAEASRAREAVRLLQRVGHLVAGIGVEEQLALHVHAREMVEIEAELVLGDLHHQAVVREGLGAQQAERPGDLPPPLVHAPGLERAGHARLAAHAHERDLGQAELGGLQECERVRGVCSGSPRSRGRLRRPSRPWAPRPTGARRRAWTCTRRRSRRSAVPTGAGRRRPRRPGRASAPPDRSPEPGRCPGTARSPPRACGSVRRRARRSPTPTRGTVGRLGCRCRSPCRRDCSRRAPPPGAGRGRRSRSRGRGTGRRRCRTCIRCRDR